MSQDQAPQVLLSMSSISGISRIVQSVSDILMTTATDFSIGSAKAVQSVLLLFVLTSLDYRSTPIRQGQESYNVSLPMDNDQYSCSSALNYQSENYTYSTPDDIRQVVDLSTLATLSRSRSRSNDQKPAETSLFSYNPNALKDVSPIPFQEEWINDFNIAPHEVTNNPWPMPESPKQLDVPEYLRVFDLSTSKSTLRTAGQQARQLIDEHLPQGSGAMLFRGLNHVIHNSSDFAVFWKHVVESTAQNDNGNSDDWNIMNDHLSCYNRKRQRLHGQVDRVDTDVPSITIGPHNEHSCNPHASSKIFFYALHTAAHGGESLLRRNQDMQVPPKAWQLLQEQNQRHAGALQFTRSYPDAQALEAVPAHERHPTEMSWQERCNTTSRQEAQEYFAQQHDIHNVTFDDEQDGTLTAHNLLPGYYSSSRDNGNDDRHQHVWFNRIDYGFPVQLADGSTFPLDLQAHLKRQKWHETTALKLQPGDWLVLDNLRVQHGRLPYRDGDDTRMQKPRQLLVTYTS